MVFVLVTMLAAAFLFASQVFTTGSVAAPAGQRSERLYGLETGKPKITFGDDGTFTLLELSDMHFGQRLYDDPKTQKVHGTVIDQEQPDYVVFNGDLVNGEDVFANNVTQLVDQLFKPTVDRNLPFSSTYGNHDNTNNVNHGVHLTHEQDNYPLSHTRSDAGPAPYGHINYWVPVYAKESDSEPSLLLWFLDSRSYVTGGHNKTPLPEQEKNRFVDDKTIPAYIKSQGDLMKKTWTKVPPSLFFSHIPFNVTDKLEPLPTDGNHDEAPHPDTQTTGRDWATWDAIVELSQSTSRVLAITHGHNHGESWCGRSSDSSGIPICYGAHSGYGGYATEHSQVRSGRVLRVSLEELAKDFPAVDTYNSFEDHSIGQRVTLDESFMEEYL